MPTILLLVLLVFADAESLSAPALRRPNSAARLTLSGQLVETDGRSFAAALIVLASVRDPRVDPYAEFMSVGPMGAPGPQDSIQSAPGARFLMDPPRRQLRVTISTGHRTSALTIDDILTRREYSRTLAAQYRVDPYFDWRVGELWRALQNAPRVLGPDPAGSPIDWLTPTTFAWTTRSDTLVFEQKADSLFKVTIHPRIR